MSSTDFKLWDAIGQEGYCVINTPEGIAKGFQLSRGISRLNGWSADTVCRMDPEFPKDIEVPDNVYGASLVVISSRLRAALSDADVTGVEFLPVRILDHKGNVAAADCMIVNPVGVVDCIDIAKSGVTWNQINKEHISICKGLVLRSDAVPTHLQIFRPKHLPSKIFVRTPLSEQLVAAGFIGLNFRSPIDFTGS